MSDPKLPFGTNYCLCRSCGLYFGGEYAFSRHRVDFRCLTPEELANAGFRLSARGYWGQDYERPKRPKVQA